MLTRWSRLPKELWIGSLAKLFRRAWAATGHGRQARKRKYRSRMSRVLRSEVVIVIWIKIPN